MSSTRREDVASIAHLLSELSDGRLNLNERELLNVPDDGGDETLGSGNGDGKIDEVSVDDGVSPCGRTTRTEVSFGPLRPLNTLPSPLTDPILRSDSPSSPSIEALAPGISWRASTEALANALMKPSLMPDSLRTASL